MTRDEGNLYPLPVHRALSVAGEVCGSGGKIDTDGAACHEAALRLADYLVYYLGAVAVGQYSQALYTGQIEPDPTLSRSLRSLRRVLPGQWLLWVARGLDATPQGPVAGLAQWYITRMGGDLATAYGVVRQVMVEQMGYTGEYGPQESVSPRLLLELIDQYRIRRAKAFANTNETDFDSHVGETLLPGLRAALGEAAFITRHPLYAPQPRHLLMGPKAAPPMPPMSAPMDAAATILLYPPGEAPDYTKRPNLQAERMPLFPLDPLLVYERCEKCDRHRVAALREVVGDIPSYLGLDPDCGHIIRLAPASSGVTA